MQEIHHITVDQVPQLLAQNREQLIVINEVVENKTKVIDLLITMDQYLKNGLITSALSCFVEIQQIEYTQQLRTLHLQQSQIQSLIHQLENPVSIPTMNMGPIPPPPGSKTRFDPPRR